MSWVKLDDRFFDNPKIAALSDPAKISYLEAACYCARELTDGFVPLQKAKSFAGKARIVQELAPQLWEPCEGGFRVHDYLKYNPPREQVLREREAAQQRMFTRRSGRSSPEQQGEHQGVVQGEVHPSPLDPPDPLVGLSNESPPQPVARERRRVVGEADLTEMREKFPGVDVDREWDKAQDWLRESGKTKKDHVAFLRNWLRRAEDDARKPTGTGRNAASRSIPPERDYANAGARFAARLGQ